MRGELFQDYDRCTKYFGYFLVFEIICRKYLRISPSFVISSSCIFIFNHKYKWCDDISRNENVKIIEVEIDDIFARESSTKLLFKSSRDYLYELRWQIFEMPLVLICTLSSKILTLMRICSPWRKINNLFDIGIFLRFVKMVKKDQV